MKLGHKRGTIRKEAACITGFATSCETQDGDQIGIVAPTLRGLKVVWERISSEEFRPEKVTRTVYFSHKSLTSLRPRRRKAHTSISCASFPKESK